MGKPWVESNRLVESKAQQTAEDGEEGEKGHVGASQ
jgi:hypothetical protein